MAVEQKMSKTNNCERKYNSNW